MRSTCTFQRNATPRAAAMRASSCVKRCASPDSSLAVKMPPASFVAARRERRLDRDALVDGLHVAVATELAHERGGAHAVRELRARRCRTRGCRARDGRRRCRSAARSARRQSREYSARFRHWIVLRRVRDGRHSIRNCRPQRHCAGSRRSRNSSGASSWPSHLMIFAGASGIGPRLRVRRRDLPAVGERRLERGACVAVDDRDVVPVLARYHAAVTPTTPAPSTMMRIALRGLPSRALSPECSCRTGCGRRRRCRRAPPAASTSTACTPPADTRQARASTRASRRRRRPPRPCAARASADCRRGRGRLPRSRGSRRESRSSRRRSGRARTSIPTPSARPSACPAPGSSSSARGSRSR